MYTVTGKQATEQEVEQMIETGESEAIFQKAIMEQGRGHVSTRPDTRNVSPPLEWRKRCTDPAPARQPVRGCRVLQCLCHASSSFSTVRVPGIRQIEEYQSCLVPSVLPISLTTCPGSWLPGTQRL